LWEMVFGLTCERRLPGEATFDVCESYFLKMGGSKKGQKRSQRAINERFPRIGLHTSCRRGDVLK